MSDDRAAELKTWVAARDAHVRESWVRAMEACIVRDQPQNCYRTEGVNHYKSCRELSEKYAMLLEENWAKGYKQVDV
ncbi:hypothetical protein EDB84DRAFT_1261008 [Lactarius hengduanensis]|nr:hypothetical protein EDB84DRAFT_1261008 [Lactarius hengduanensis]